VYHSVFDNYKWFTLNADPKFVYLEEMARVLGLETVRMADADVLPLDYTAYGRAVLSYLDAAKRKAADQGLEVDFTSAQEAAGWFNTVAVRTHGWQTAGTGDLNRLNHALRQAETDLTTPEGLPNRPWYRHTIYAPGEYTGYAAVVIPGVNEALDARDAGRAAQQLEVLTHALQRATHTLEGGQ
jgi:N-acetylated-alpha-linked acidic dipeptidase